MGIDDPHLRGEIPATKALAKAPDQSLGQHL